MQTYSDSHVISFAERNRGSSKSFLVCKMMIIRNSLYISDKISTVSLKPERSRFPLCRTDKIWDLNNNRRAAYSTSLPHCDRVSRLIISVPHFGCDDDDLDSKEYKPVSSDQKLGCEILQKTTISWPKTCVFVKYLGASNSFSFWRWADRWLAEKIRNTRNAQKTRFPATPDPREYFQLDLPYTWFENTLEQHETLLSLSPPKSKVVC